MYQLVEEMRDRVQHKAVCTLGYGHLGDGETLGAALLAVSSSSSSSSSFSYR